MALAVSLVGIMIGLLAGVGVLAPFRVMGWLTAWRGTTRFAVAVAMRVVVGSLFIWVAPTCRTPRTIFWLGVVTLVAAAGLLILGPRRLDALVDWWSGQPTSLVVASFAAAALFGCFLVYAGW